MSSLSSTKPDSWTLSPQMTAAPELWRHVTFLLPLWERAGVPRDASAWGHTVSIGDNSPSWTNTVLGSATQGTTTNDEWVITDEGAWDNTDFHTVFGVAIYGNRDNDHMLNWGSVQPGSLIIRENVVDASRPDGTLTFTFRDNNDTATNLDVETTMAAGDPMAFVARVKDGQQDLYIMQLESREEFNGGLAISLSGGTKSGAGDFYIQNHPSNTRSYNSDIVMVGHAHAFWNVTKMRHFLADPFAMLRPAGF